jgi:hypothetical protein
LENSSASATNYFVQFPQTVEIRSSGGATMVVTDFVGSIDSATETSAPSDSLNPSDTTSPDKEDTLKVGASLVVSPKQPGGYYSGEFTVTVVKY